MSKLPLALALSLIAAPAFAGPIGSGLWLTESVARARAASISISAADASCLQGVAASVAGHNAVRAAAVKDGKLAVQFRSAGDRAAETQAVHAIVAKACAGAQVAAA